MANTIITVPTPVTPLPPLVQQATMLAKQQAASFLQDKAVYEANTRFIWGDPTKAQSKFDAFTAAGYKATDLIVNAAAFITLAATFGITVSSPVPTGYSLTANQDGTVTVVKA